MTESSKTRPDVCIFCRKPIDPDESRAVYDDGDQAHVACAVKHDPQNELSECASNS